MNEDALTKAWSDHSRLWEKNVWVYPVISRRAGGLSIGVNLNLDKRCSFNCVYCQVDRTIPGLFIPVDIDRIDHEIEILIAEYEKNGLTRFANFQEVNPEQRRIKDISLSGDGESTLVPEFPHVCKRLREIQERHSKYNLKLTLITNSTQLEKPRVREGLRYLTEKNGEIWTKLDAGSEAWFQKINVTPYSLEKIQSGIELTIVDFPVCIQTLFCQIDTDVPSEQEIILYMDRVRRIYEKNPANLREVQLYGVIRHTARPRVFPVEKSFLEAIARKLRQIIPVKIKVY
jgi:wyosine [tRNA(Phe)-imidazoG37] synthetase (radical SAM superfamily)